MSGIAEIELARVRSICEYDAILSGPNVNGLGVLYACGPADRSGNVNANGGIFAFMLSGRALPGKDGDRLREKLEARRMSQGERFRREIGEAGA